MTNTSKFQEWLKNRFAINPVFSAKGVQFRITALRDGNYFVENLFIGEVIDEMPKVRRVQRQFQEIDGRIENVELLHAHWGVGIPRLAGKWVFTPNQGAYIRNRVMRDEYSHITGYTIQLVDGSVHLMYHNVLAKQFSIVFFETVDSFLNAVES